MNLGNKANIVLPILLVSIGVDQFTKYFAFNTLRGSELQSYFYDSLRIVYSENIGAFLGMGNMLPAETRFWLFTVLVGLFLLTLLVYLFTAKKISPVELAALSLVFSGGVSNFYDRATHSGAVIDFLNLGIGSVRTGIFNVADMAIMLGAAMILVVSFKRNDRREM